MEEDHIGSQWSEVEGGAFSSETPVNGLRLALGHQARVGKDTFADHVIERWGGCKMQFAGPIYDIGRAVQERLGRPVEKDPALLQTIGTSLKAVYGGDVWLAPLLARLQTMPPTSNVLITDMRFPNEMAALKAAGFTTVKITRPGRIIDRDPNHISEIALADAEFDYTINNCAGMDTYLAQVDAVVAAVVLR